MYIFFNHFFIFNLFDWWILMHETFNHLNEFYKFEWANFQAWWQLFQGKGKGKGILLFLLSKIYI